MKGISSTLLALIFAAFSLFSLMTANRTWEESPVPLGENQARVSDLGLRFALHR